MQTSIPNYWATREVLYHIFIHSPISERIGLLPYRGCCQRCMSTGVTNSLNHSSHEGCWALQTIIKKHRKGNTDSVEARPEALKYTQSVVVICESVYSLIPENTVPLYSHARPAQSARGSRRPAGLSRGGGTDSSALLQLVLQTGVPDTVHLVPHFLRLCVLHWWFCCLKWTPSLVLKGWLVS